MNQTKKSKENKLKNFSNKILSSALKQYIVISLLIITAFAVSAGNVIVKNGQLNVSGSTIIQQNLTVYGVIDGNLNVSGSAIIQQDLTVYNNVNVEQSGDSYPRVQVNNSGNINFGSGSSNPDVNLYRSSNNVLKTDDNLIVNGWDVGEIGVKFDKDGQIIVRSSTSNNVISVKQSNDSNSRLVIKGSGMLAWGNGTITPDVNLYRQNSSTLRTDNSFMADQFIDGTPYFSDGKKALEDFAKIKDDGNGNINHSTLPEFTKVNIGVNENTGEVEYGRSLSSTVSMLVAANLELEKRNLELENRVDSLEARVSELEK